MKREEAKVGMEVHNPFPGDGWTKGKIVKISEGGLLALIKFNNGGEDWCAIRFLRTPQLVLNEIQALEVVIAAAKAQAEQRDADLGLSAEELEENRKLWEAIEILEGS